MGGGEGKSEVGFRLAAVWILVFSEGKWKRVG